MPKSHKDLMKRTVAQAVNHINQAATYISELEDEFRPVHPEYADGLVNILKLLSAALEVVNVFAGAAWGMSNPDWEKWQ